MKKILIMSLLLFVLIVFSAVSIFAQGPIGAGATPTKVIPSPTPTVTSTPAVTPTPSSASNQPPASGQKTDTDKALEIGQAMLSDRSFAEKVMRILVILNDGKLAGGDLGGVFNAWTISVLTSLRDGAGGLMFPDFLADTGINKVSYAISIVIIALAILTIGLSTIKSMKNVVDGSFSGKIAVVYLLGLVGFILFLVFQPNIYDLLAKGCKKVIWWLGKQAAVTAHPGEDPFTFLVTTILSLGSSAIGFGPTKTLGQLILIPALTAVSLFLLANTIWLLLLTTFGQIGMGLVFLSGQRSLSSFFLILSEIGLTFLNATLIYIGLLTLVIVATGPKPMAEPLLVLGVGAFVILSFAVMVNLFLRLLVIFPIFRRLRVFEGNLIGQIQAEAVSASSPPMLEDSTLWVNSSDGSVSEFQGEDFSDDEGEE